MKPVIDLRKLEIYYKYGGDIDGLLKIGKKSDLDAFGSYLDETWSKITSLIQDIELIEKGLVSKEYEEKSINEIKSLCDKSAFEKLTKILSMNRISFLDIIKDYQSLADKAVKIFQNKYQVNNILEGWHSRKYEQTGKLPDEGLSFYAFHGIGLAAHFKDEIVDFDFAFFPEPRHDGFDLWRLTNFIQNQIAKYPEYEDNKKIEREFNDLIKNGVIAKPKLEFSTTLYFFKDTLNTELIEKTESKSANQNVLPKTKQNWWKKLFGD
ncbi:DUF6896 domain-containing protein [Fluviicola chungangensis]|uniref:DUF6896 domain-containing protein n=1 Tax=Fluviicola chungangensis TaxID=2597671 RepID=A0A556N649_9FLAO|nr:hypothetical protein [Fluviicola chungangensis]TSJ47605.1 hypothetical protein FO442_00310 [Fluviicola chungangensis]